MPRAHEKSDLNAATRFDSHIPVLGIDLEILIPVKYSNVALANLGQAREFSGLVFYLEEADEVLEHVRHKCILQILTLP